MSSKRKQNVNDRETGTPLFILTIKAQCITKWNLLGQKFKTNNKEYSEVGFICYNKFNLETCCY